jgi:hypothetical protein
MLVRNISGEEIRIDIPELVKKYISANHLLGVNVPAKNIMLMDDAGKEVVLDLDGINQSVIISVKEDTDKKMLSGLRMMLEHSQTLSSHLAKREKVDMRSVFYGDRELLLSIAKEERGYPNKILEEMIVKSQHILSIVDEVYNKSHDRLLDYLYVGLHDTLTRWHIPSVQQAIAEMTL